MAVAAALGASVPTLADWFERVYGVRGATLVETCQQLTYNSDGPYQATGTPKSLDHKFITEDVPTGLIPMSALGVEEDMGWASTFALPVNAGLGMGVEMSSVAAAAGTRPTIFPFAPPFRGARPFVLREGIERPACAPCIKAERS